MVVSLKHAFYLTCVSFVLDYYTVPSRGISEAGFSLCVFVCVCENVLWCSVGKFRIYMCDNNHHHLFHIDEKIPLNYIALFSYQSNHQGQSVCQFRERERNVVRTQMWVVCVFVGKYSVFSSTPT